MRFARLTRSFLTGIHTEEPMAVLHRARSRALPTLLLISTFAAPGGLLAQTRSPAGAPTVGPPKGTVIVVGVGHLVGKDSVPNRLRALGVQVDGPR